jgi:hypothetical protein
MIGLGACRTRHENRLVEPVAPAAPAAPVALEGRTAGPSRANHGEIDDLLRRLTSWESRYGVRFAHDPALATTGESSAAIADLKRRLNERGARYHWRESARSYVLDSIGPPPGREGDPDLGKGQ